MAKQSHNNLGRNPSKFRNVLGKYCPCRILFPNQLNGKFIHEIKCIKTKHESEATDLIKDILFFFIHHFHKWINKYYNLRQNLIFIDIRLHTHINKR